MTTTARDRIKIIAAGPGFAFVERDGQRIGTVQRTTITEQDIFDEQAHTDHRGPFGVQSVSASRERTVWAGADAHAELRGQWLVTARTRREAAEALADLA